MGDTSKEELNKCAEILQAMADACRESETGNTSWSQACKVRNLKPKAVMKVISNLHKCSAGMMPLTDIEDSIYDQYERFYQAVFGDRIMKRAILPPDYRESAIHVVDSLEEKESYVLMQHFGLDGHDRETLEEIGRHFGVKGERIRNIEAKALLHCRLYGNIDILKMGLAKFNQLKEQKEEQFRLESEHRQQEHEAFLKKQDAEHDRNMGVIEKCGSDDAAEKLFSDKIKDDLADTEIAVLDLMARPYNCLCRARIYNVYALLELGGMSQIVKKVPHMGNISALNIVENLDRYVQKEYHMTAEKLRSILFKE